MLKYNWVFDNRYGTKVLKSVEVKGSKRNNNNFGSGLNMKEPFFLYGTNMSDMTGASNDISDWTNNSGWSIPIIADCSGTCGEYKVGPAWPTNSGLVQNPTDFTIGDEFADWFRFKLCSDHDMKLIRIGATARRLIKSDPSKWATMEEPDGVSIVVYKHIFDYCRKNYPDFKFILCPHDDSNGCGWVDDSGSSQQLNYQQITDMWALLAKTFKSYSNVYFEIWNEPRNWNGSKLDLPAIGTQEYYDLFETVNTPSYGLSTELYEDAGGWYNICKSVINKIRTIGAHNKILVPGIFYTGVHSWMSYNASTFVNIGADISNIEDFAFSMHQYYDSPDYGGKVSGHDVSEEDINGWFDVDTQGSVSEWLKTNKYKAYLTETNILYDSSELVKESDSGWTDVFKLVMTNIRKSCVWRGVTAWTSVYNYNNKASSGNIMNGPSAEGATWSTGMFSTAPWFAIGKINDGPIEGYRVGPQQLYNR